MPSSFSARWTIIRGLRFSPIFPAHWSLSAFLVRDMIWLRELAIGSSLVWIGAMVGTGHLIVASIFWNTLFVSINTWQILAILREDRSVDFTEEERALFEGLFRGFKPGEFLKISSDLENGRISQEAKRSSRKEKTPKASGC